MISETKGDQLGIEFFSGVVRGTVFGTAAALDTRISLQGGDLGNIFARDHAEIVVAHKRRYVTKAPAF